MEGKEGFILYKSFYEPIKALSLEEKGQLLDAIFQFHINAENNNPDNPKNPDNPLGSNAKMAFEFMMIQFRLDRQKYLNVVERNRKNGKKGGRPLKNKITQKPKKADKDKDKEKDKDIERRFSPNHLDSPVQQKSNSKDSFQECTYFELWNIAKDLQIPLESVKDKQQALLELVDSGEMQRKYPKNKSTYHTLRTWLRSDIAKGYVSVFDEMGKLHLNDQHPDKLKEREEWKRETDAQEAMI